MKIGIVTQPLHANYGGILQNYALQQVLKRLGHEPITIDYYWHTSRWIYLLSCIKTLLLYFIPKKRRKFNPYSITKRTERSLQNERFVRKYISITNPTRKYNNSIIKKYNLDALVTGSDQVWRPMYNPCLKDMFLGFVKSNDVKKVAYAASFGTDLSEYTETQIKRCRKYAQKLNAISVRESSGVVLCRQYFEVDAIEVLDPTLLLNKEDYMAICESVPLDKNIFLAAYVLDIDDKKKAFIQDIANKLGLSVKFLSADNEATLSIEEWLAMFRDATYVITNSFHGSVFSIIFNKPFISIGNSHRGLSRFHSLLDKFNLYNRLVDETTIANIPYINQEINWTHVNENRNNLKSKSLNFLNDNLKNR